MSSRHRTRCVKFATLLLIALSWHLQLPSDARATHLYGLQDCYYQWHPGNPNAQVKAPCANANQDFVAVARNIVGSAPLPPLPSSCNPAGVFGGFDPYTCIVALAGPPPDKPFLPGLPTYCHYWSIDWSATRCLSYLSGPPPSLPPTPTVPPGPPVPVPVPDVDNPDDCKHPIFSPTDPGDVERCAAALLEEILPGSCRSLDKLDCPDNDGDGVHDRFDACPGQYGDAPNGCRDSDRDGIEDRADRCPGTPGTPPSGCPDGDGDGVPDPSDECPDMPGAGTATGCPEPGEETLDPDTPPDTREDALDGADEGGTDADYAGGWHSSCVSDGAGDDYCANTAVPNAMESVALREPPLSVTTGVETPVVPDTTRSADRSDALRPGRGGWGFSTQQGAVFNRPRFLELQVEKVRRAVPWDVVLRSQRSTSCGAQGDPATMNALAATREFIRDAAARNFEVTISFERCQNNTEWSVLPPISEYNEAVRAFRREFGGMVRAYSAWNEPNHRSQPTSRYRRGGSFDGAERAAWYWRHLKKACDSVRPEDAGLTPCIPLAGEFADNPSFSPTYYRTYKQGLGGRRPWFWAFHVYGTGMTRGAAPNFYRRFANNVPPNPDGNNPGIWLTEAGGVYDRGPGYNRRPDAIVEDDLRWLLTDLLDSDNKIKRFYYYGWQAPAYDSWDSAMVGTNGRRRLTYYIYRKATTGT